MKKFVPMILVLALLLSMSISAAATENPVVESQNVNVTYVPAKAAGTVISVDIEWSGMDFTYNEASRTWNAATHQYDEKAGGWEDGYGTITITNNSSVILQADISYTPETDFSDIFMAFTNQTPYIGSAYTNENGQGAACEVQVLAVPKGDLEEALDKKTTIGTVKVTVETGGTWDAVAGEIEGNYTKIKSSDGTGLERGTVYYTAADVTAVENAYGELAELIDQGVTNEAQINAALNPAIVAYYNSMKIGQ